MLPYPVYIWDGALGEWVNHGNLRGVGIQKIEQISSSTDSLGANVIRVTLDDDSFYDYTVRNGDRGPAGSLWIGTSEPPDDSYSIWLNPSGMVSGYVGANQGAENAGRVLAVGEDGVVIPREETPYTLPQASPDALGGIKADAAETADTQPVRIGGDGKLYTAPGSGGADISLGISGATAGQMAKVKAVDESGAPTAWEAGDAASGGGTNGEKIVEIANGVDVSTVSSFSYSTDMDGNPLKANRFSIMLNAPNATKDDAWVEMTVNGITVLRMYYYKNKKINLRTIIHPTYCEHILYLSAINGLNGAYVGSNESQYGVVRFVGAIDQDLTKAEKTIILKYNHGINDPTWGDNAKLWMWGE